MLPPDVTLYSLAVDHSSPPLINLVDPFARISSLSHLTCILKLEGADATF